MNVHTGQDLRWSLCVVIVEDVCIWSQPKCDIYLLGTADCAVDHQFDWTQAAAGLSRRHALILTLNPPPLTKMTREPRSELCAGCPVVWAGAKVAAREVPIGSDSKGHCAIHAALGMDVVAESARLFQCHGYLV